MRAKLLLRISFMCLGNEGVSLTDNPCSPAKVAPTNSPAPTDDDRAAKWAKFIGLHRINNLFDADTGRIFTQQDMHNYTHKYAPSRIRGTPEAHEWADDLMQSWTALAGSIPAAVLSAAKANVRVQEGMYVAFTPEDKTPVFYAKAEMDSTQGPGYAKFHIQQLDTFSTPHDTGKYVSTMQALRTPVAPAVLWIEEAKEDAHYTFQNSNAAPTDDLDDDDQEPPRVYIIGPPSHAFPIAEGWTPADPHPHPENPIPLPVVLQMRHGTRRVNVTLESAEDSMPIFRGGKKSLFKEFNQVRLC